MKVSLDGGTTWVDAPEGVRIDVEGFGEEDKSLLFNFTNEGVITDLWDKPPTEECLGTTSSEYTDIAAMVLEYA